MGGARRGRPCHRADTPDELRRDLPNAALSPRRHRAEGRDHPDPLPQPFRLGLGAAGGSISLPLSRARKGGRAVECTGLENQQAGNPRFGGSNPPPSVGSAVACGPRECVGTGASLARVVRWLREEVGERSASDGFERADSAGRFASLVSLLRRATAGVRRLWFDGSVSSVAPTKGDPCRASPP